MGRVWWSISELIRTIRAGGVLCAVNEFFVNNFFFYDILRAGVVKSDANVIVIQIYS